MKYHQFVKNMNKILIIPIQFNQQQYLRENTQNFYKNDLFEMVQSLHYHIYVIDI